jgi:hypothetical protein
VRDVSLDHAKFEKVVLRHGGCDLELIPLESEHLLFNLSVCEVLRSFDMPAHQNFGVPSKYGRWSRLCDTANGCDELVVLGLYVRMNY